MTARAGHAAAAAALAGKKAVPVKKAAVKKAAPVGKTKTPTTKVKASAKASADRPAAVCSHPEAKQEYIGYMRVCRECGGRVR